MYNLSRRMMIKAAGAMAMSALASPGLAAKGFVADRPKFVDYPFKLGVASGDILPTGFVIWTRLAPNPLDPHAVGPDPVRVGYEVALDSGFKKVVKSGAVVAYGDNAHAVHVEVDGLEPGRHYWYRFRAGSEISPVGRAFTAPAFLSPVDKFRFAFCSCQQYEMGFFKAYRDMIAQDVDMIVHLGDYIYESTWNGPLRRAPAANARAIDEYRLLHAAYKLDEDLQAAHRHTSWLFTWDDHEVVNDYAADQDQDFEDPKTFLMRRAAAYKAYFEHLPLRTSARPKGPDMRLYQRLWIGDLLEFNMLDTRQYRSDQPCQLPNDGGWRKIDASCAERFDEKRSILGGEQEYWLTRWGGVAGARWNVLAQGMLFSQHDMKPGDGVEVGNEYWDGYIGSRRRVLDMVERRGLTNTVIIGGDVHASYVCDVKKDFDDQNSPTLATEFVTTSVTSPQTKQGEIAKTLSDNPHIKRYDGRYRGYTLCDVSHKEWVTDLRVVNDVTQKELVARSNGKYIVRAGQPGAVEA